MEREPLRVDVAVVGAGIAGLWLANLLVQRGLAVAVCDPNPLGGKQTIASQGIIHSGAKYSFGDMAAALETMPDRWRACLAGDGEVDLRGVPLLADHVHLFSPTIGGRMRTIVANRVLAGRSRRLDARQCQPYGRGLLLALDDFVVDVPALIRQLATPLAPRVVARNVSPSDGGIDATVFLLAAGEGNGALAARAGFGAAAMRRRPLRQVLVRLCKGVPLFAHCLSTAFGTVPDMTITSHGNVLYVGGKIADDGAHRSPGEQVDRLRRLLADAFPSIDLKGAEFDTFAIDRAEPGRAAAGDAFAERRGNCVLCWPVKLSLVPRLGDLVMGLLKGLQPRPDPWQGIPGKELRVAEPPWQRAC